MTLPFRVKQLWQNTEELEFPASSRIVGPKYAARAWFESRFESRFEFLPTNYTTITVSDITTIRNLYFY